MSTITIRKLGQDVKSRLRVRAARHGRSTEAEAREIVKQAAIRLHIDPIGGVDLDIPPRQPIRRPPNLT